jgi:hypothetical protein
MTDCGSVECVGCKALIAREKTLEAEIEKIQLEMFWFLHGVSNLQDSMYVANQEAAMQCNCLACAVSGRFVGANVLTGIDCRFKPYFEALLAECGLIAEPCELADAVVHVSNNIGNCVYINDVHFVTIGRDDWCSFSYGAKFWKNPISDKDPELRKLMRLFELLDKK